MLHTPKESKRQGLTLPQSPGTQLAVLERACEELAHYACLETVKSFIDQAEAFRHYAQSAKKGLELVNKAAEVKIRAERRAGQLLAELHLHGGDRLSDSQHQRATLKELNISQNQSARWQRAAEVPEEEFQKMIEAAHKNHSELSTAALLRLAKARRKHHELTRQCEADLPTQRLPTRQSTTCSPEEIISELANPCAVFDDILSTIYDATGPVDLGFAERKHLRRLVREFRSLLDELKQHVLESCSKK